MLAAVQTSGPIPRVAPKQLVSVKGVAHPGVAAHAEWPQMFD